MNRGTQTTELTPPLTIVIVAHESGPRGARSQVIEHAQPVSERGVSAKTLCGKRPRPGFYGRWTSRTNDVSLVTCEKCKGRMSRLDVKLIAA